LLGGSTPTFYAYCVAPKFVEKKEYREGIHTIVFEYERFLPQAKSLNMLPSYIGFSQAKQAGAFDALCVNRDGNITEGTRTNFFAVQGTTIYTPKESEILLGITRTHVLACAKKHDWSIEETDIPLATLTKTYDGAFLTNTSSGIVPIRSVGDASFSTIPEKIQLLRTQYKQYIQEINQ
jgi:branched-chain amino acid aminotransferase